MKRMWLDHKLVKNLKNLKIKINNGNMSKFKMKKLRKQEKAVISKNVQ